MARLTITMPNSLYGKISGLAAQNQESMSAMINQLLIVGMQQLDNNSQDSPLIEEHCQQLIIQMNVLIKKLSEKLLNLDKEDFNQLRIASQNKYENLVGK